MFDSFLSDQFFGGYPDQRSVKSLPLIDRKSGYWSVTINPHQFLENTMNFRSMGYVGSVFAVDKNGTMGKNMDLPWGKIKEDMQFFRLITLGSVVVMGKNTWYSKNMLRPLPHRYSAVLTNNPRIEYDRFCEEVDILEDFLTQFVTFSSVNPSKLFDFLEHLHQEYALPINIIGGPDVLMQFKEFTQTAYISKINKEYEGDIKINLEEYLKGFKKIMETPLSELVTVEKWQNETVS